MTLERASALIGAAIAEAKKRDWTLNVAAVDSGGNLAASRAEFPSSRVAS
jgi:glc operon protein GlcG